MEEKDKGKDAPFYEGIERIDRINFLQKEINECWSNPLAFNLEKKLYNYEIIFNNLTSLFSEGSPNFSETEMKKGDIIKKMINRILRESPPHWIKENINHELEECFSKENWFVLEHKLFNFGIYVRKLLDSHKPTPSKKSKDDM